MTKEETEKTRSDILSLLEERAESGRPIAYAHIARNVGLSPATVSNFMAGKLADDSKYTGILAKFVERERARESDALLNIPFVLTRQSKHIMRAIDFAHRYGRIAAVIAPPGVGKSCTIEEARRRDVSLLSIRAARFFTPRALFSDIIMDLGDYSSGSMHVLFDRLRSRLSGSGRCLVIDDAHFLASFCLDAVQSLYDQTGIGIVLCGIRSLRRRLLAVSEESEQMSSRLSGRIWDVPAVVEADLSVILSSLMSGEEVELSLDVLRADPAVLTSPRRLCNCLEIAGRMAAKSPKNLNSKHIQSALKVA